MVSNGLNYPVNHPTITLICTFIAIFTLAVKAHASAYPTKIKQQAEEYLYSIYSVEQPLARTSIKLRPPSTQLNLSRCKQPITFKHAPTRASRVSIAAQCHNPKWRVFLTGTVEQWLPVVHTTRPLNKGTILGAKDLALIETDVRKINQAYFTDRAELFNRRLKRTLRSKKIITAQALSKHLLVRKGDHVVIEAKNGSMMVRMNGTALEDGEQGKQINVRNTRSGRVVRAYVSRVGVVSVTP
nr:flagellar basal body P-ring formation chaperone FlgA [Aliamphritea spongicola]